MTILVTGGCGYIGSHTVLALLQDGHDVVVLDNLSNSSAESLRRVARISGRKAILIEGDIRNKTLVAETLETYVPSAVIHFAGLKSVGESVSKPIYYYDNNVNGTLVLLQAMADHGIRRIVFSSSATVYGNPQFLPLTEAHPLSTTNPYGSSKLMLEQVLRDVAIADPQWQIGILRYFNPVGAHESGLIGENPNGIPNNLMPFITQVAVGRRDVLSVFGSDYPTHDGTGVRDYIHVVDLANGHLRALDYLLSHGGVFTVNLGTGVGYSVLDMVRAFEQVSGRGISYQLVDRRPGDVAACYADPALAARILNWRAERDLSAMCRDAWRWQQSNPHGYN